DGVEPVGHALGTGVDVEAFRQLGILSGDADRTPAGVAVMAVIRSGPQGVVVFNVKRLVAIEGDQRGRADVDGIGAQSQRLGGVAAVANTAGDNQLDLAVKFH